MSSVDARPVRLLGVQIANGFSPEARVFAGLLAHADRGLVQPTVLHHAWSADSLSATRFRALAGDVSVVPMDFGWRPPTGNRSVAQKIRARLQFFSALPRALSAARALKPDIIYSCQQYWDCQAATYIARRLRRPQVIHLHYIIGPWLHRPVLARLSSCDHIVCVSDFIRQEAIQFGVPGDRVTTVRNAITVAPPPEGAREEVRARLQIPPDAPLLGIVARIDPDKGQADTIRAFARCAAHHPAARLLVVGSETIYQPGYAEKIRELVAELSLNEQVMLLGPRDDVPLLLAALDIFVHPSRRDPCPLALLESAAAGLPAIAYAEGGANEIVENGVTGLLAPPGDIDGLAVRMAELLADPTRARAMGSAARLRMARQFRPEDAGAAFANLLCQQFRPGS